MPSVSWCEGRNARANQDNLGQHITAQVGGSRQFSKLEIPKVVYSTKVEAKNF